MSKTVKYWEAKAAAALVGKTIKAVRYLTDTELDNLDWTNRTLVIQLSNGEFIYASADDEGNDAGALFTTIDDLETIPVIHRGAV